MKLRPLAFALALALCVIACSKDSAPPPPSGPLSSFVVTIAPPGAKAVLAARGDASVGDSITLVGRAKDFVTGRAAFTLIDSSLLACSDEGDPMDGACKTPWDYCCIDPEEVSAACALVELRDAQGLIKSDVKGLAGLDHLDTVFATGVVEKDAAGNFTLVAKSLHVRKGGK